MILVLVVSAVSGSAAAQSGFSGNIIVEEGETVSAVNAVSGTVIIRGTVTGDVSAAAGDVVIDGTVEGNVNVAAGNVRISGIVGGDVSAGAGNIHLTEDGVIRGNLEAGAGTVQIDGTIQGNAAIGAETIRLGEQAEIAGSLRYDGNLVGNRDAVAGDITRDSTLGIDLATELHPLATWVFTVYTFLLNLLLGAALLGLFPRFSRSVADQVATSPVRSGLIGLGVLIGVPILLVAIALTIIGIPLTIAGAFLFVLIAWIAIVYGRFAIGVWILSLARIDNRWLGLVVGLLIGAILAQIPIIGGLLNFIIFLLGLGAVATSIYYHRRRSRAAPVSAPAEETPTD